VSERKLTNDQVEDILEAVAARKILRKIVAKLSNRALAKTYEVSDCTIERIARGERYQMHYKPKTTTLKKAIDRFK